MMRRRTLWTGLALPVAVAGLLAVAGCGEGAREPAGRGDTLADEATSEALQKASYVGSETCLKCHAEKGGWAHSLHKFKLRALDEPGATGTVLVNDSDGNGVDDFTDGLDFNDPKPGYDVTGFDTQASKGVAPVLGKEGGTPTITIGEVTYEVKYVLGGNGKWKQRYVTQIGNSHYILPVQYNETTRQYVAYSPGNWYDENGDPIYAAGETPLTKGRVNDSYERRCTGCHNTGLAARVVFVNGEWVADLDNGERNVGCEACHGPGSRHAAAPTAEGSIVNPDHIAAERDVDGDGDTDTVDTLLLKNSVCTSCHSRGSGKFEANGAATGYPSQAAADGSFVPFLPGEYWLDYYIPTTKDGDLWKDPDTGAVLGSKAHHQQGMDLNLGPHAPDKPYDAPCFECHDVHRGADEVEAAIAGEIEGVTIPVEDGEADGVVLCLACHAGFGPFGSLDKDTLRAAVEGDTTAEATVEETVKGHTRHPAEVSECANCHMPKTAKSAIKYDIRSHTFEIIEPKESKTTAAGIPNACGGCHVQGLEESQDAWADRLQGYFEYLFEGGETITVVDDGYVGTKVCATCHEEQYEEFRLSGHNYKLNKVVAGRKPTYPFSELPDASVFGVDGLTDGDNTLGPPADYGDVSYVIGGYGWKARFIDKNGYIVTGADTQYNLPRTDLEGTYPDLGKWVAYDDGVVDKEYNQGCFKCHTTGAEDLNDPDNVNPDLPGFGGDRFAMPGIQCERCHGMGAKHANSLDPEDIDHPEDEAGSMEASDLCGECHTRDGENRIAASGGLVKHHEQYDEFLRLPIDADGTVTGAAEGGHYTSGVGCVGCHDPHKTTRYQDVASTGRAIRQECIDCHEGYDEFTEEAAPMAGEVDCEDCHMPRMAKSAVKSEAEGSGPALGDIRSHIFKIDTSASSQFTSDGKLAFPAITAEFACKTCHNGEEETDEVDFEIRVHVQTPDESPTYVGTATCAVCHDEQYQEFKLSGHNYKLNQVTFDTKPTYPFSEIPDASAFGVDGLTDGDNALGPPTSYADVAYVIGGYGWKARFIDKNGYIVTGADTQYNLPRTDLEGTYPDLGKWVAYDDGEVDKPYDYSCFKCHTTGPENLGDPNANPGLPGFGGDRFAEAGIQCEACHGPGSSHALSRNPEHIEIDTTAELCGRCHTRDAQGRIAASGGLVKHHEQYDELRGINPDDVNAGPTGAHYNAGITCVTCHDPHKTTRYQDVASTGRAIRQECIDCHEGYDDLTVDAMEGEVECEDCHMPRLAKSAVKSDPEGPAPAFGGIRSHIVKIDLSAADQFTSDGKFAYPWITRSFACMACHNDAEEPADDATGFTGNMHVSTP
ncbi:multiheme c-type cytochrome [Deferrisoma camini]|uniref:multiheme c-type cytochrome n=1 Tax=Deferrisoma camini TaxID=1035120 RepID=UPI00046D6C1F|nr:multiheme c-type cytochrome [Deferrisoma camini]